MHTTPAMILLLWIAIGPVQNGLVANDQGNSESMTTESAQDNEFEFSKREISTEKYEFNYDLKESLGDSGIKVLICVGIFLIGLIALTRKKTERRIPVEAVEVLGTIPIGGRQNIQLIRFGQKLVLIEMSPNGLKPISEITDPMEVNQMLDQIRPRVR